MTGAPSVLAAGIPLWADRAPTRVALTDAQQSLTFAEVEQQVAARAAQIAALPMDDVAPASISFTPWLPVLVDRTVESALTVHALIRAGRPFVPVDHASPPDRLTEILDRLGRPPVALVARSAFAAALPPGIAAVHPDGTASDRLDPVPVDLDTAAFIVFTSGSTGQPKAIVRRWRAFANRVEEQAAQTMCTPGEPWNAATMQPFTFLPGHRGLGAMALGRTMHITDPASMSAASLVEWFRTRQINEATFSATLLRSLLETVGPALHLPQLRLVRLTSEASTWDLVESIRRFAAPDVVITAGYSATEVGRTFHLEIPPDMPVGTGNIPLGRPLHADRVRLEPVDDDPTVRQLVILTDESLGYLDSPELNLRRYAPGPDGLVWWYSGDVAAVDEHGMYTHAGRIDDMVKISGLLVEPREAETALLAVPGVAAAAVLPQRRSSGKYRLVAHVVIDDESLTAESVRTALRRVLPAHLVPAVFVRHDSLPFTERNKLDRTALQSQALVRWRSSRVRPIYDETTRWIATRVAEIVEVDDVGADEDIWDLGLDSLGAVELCAAISEAGFGEIEPTLLLTVNTPTRIAEALGSSRNTSGSPVVVMNADGARDPMFFVPGGAGTALAFRSLAHALGSEQPLVIVEPRGLHQHLRPDHSIRRMGGRVADEVTARLAPGKHCTLIGYSSGATTAFEAAHQLMVRGVDVRLVFLDATVRGKGIGRDGAPLPGVNEVLNHRRDGRSLRQLAAESPRIAGRLVLRIARGVLPRIDRRIVYLPWRTPRYDQRHYERFGALIGRARQRYRPRPLPAHITVIESAGIGRGENTRPYATSVTVLHCGGDHFTMLEPPHVAELAAHIRSLVDAAR